MCRFHAYFISFSCLLAMSPLAGLSFLIFLILLLRSFTGDVFSQYIAVTCICYKIQSDGHF